MGAIHEATIGRPPLDKTVMPGQSISPALGDARISPDAACDLTCHGANSVGVVAEIDGLEDGFLE